MFGNGLPTSTIRSPIAAQAQSVGNPAIASRFKKRKTGFDTKTGKVSRAPTPYLRSASEFYAEGHSIIQHRGYESPTECTTQVLGDCSWRAFVARRIRAWLSRAKCDFAVTLAAELGGYLRYIPGTSF